MSHKLFKIFSMLLIVSVLLTACGGAAPAATQPAAPAVSCDAARKELYSMLPKVSLVGIRDDMALASRADIQKAWPKTPKDSKTLTIGWSEIAMANPWFVAVKDSAIAEAKKKGYTLNFLVAEGDPVKQSQHIDTFIDQGVDVIVIDPVDTTAVILDIQRAVKAGIPVIAIGAAPSGEAPILTTISDNAYQVGYGAGEYAGSTFAKDEPINIGAIPGKLGNTTAESRTGGMVGGVVAARQKALGKFVCKEEAILVGYKLWEEAKKNGSATNADLNVSIVAMGEGGWSQEGGLAAAEPMLTAHGSKLNLMIADNEFMCFGILKAVEAAGLTDKIKVGAPSDGFNDALKMIADGKLLVSGSWNGDQQGAHAIDFLEAIFFKGKDPSNLPLGSFFPPLTFTKDNAAQYINPDPKANFFAVPEFVFPKSINELKGEPAAPAAVQPATSEDACAVAKKELYSMLPKVSLVGIRDDAALTSRADIQKAWPKIPKDSKTLTIGWSEIAMANPWFVAVKDSAIAEAKKKGYTLNFLVAEGDPVKQSQHIDTFIDQGVDVIVIDPVDTTAVILDIQRAVEAGIPVVVVGAAPSGEAPILTTISDNAYQVGYGAGEYAGSTFAKDEPINIGAIPGKLGNTTAESRTGGMVGGMVAARQKALGKFVCKEDAILVGYKLWEEAKKNGSATNADLNVSIVAMGEGGWSQEGGLAAAEPMLTAHGSKLNIMIADNEFMCFGILKAVEAAGLTDKIKVGAPSDGFNDALKMIADGKLLVSGSWNGDQQGAHAIEFLEAIFFEGKDPGNLPLGSFFPPLTFTKDNAAQYINPDPKANFFAVPEFVFPSSIDELKAK